MKEKATKGSLQKTGKAIVTMGAHQACFRHRKTRHGRGQHHPISLK